MVGSKHSRESVIQEAVRTIVETQGGRIQVCWDGKSAGTPLGQMTFFIEFLMFDWLIHEVDWDLPSEMPRTPSLKDDQSPGHLIFVSIMQVRGISRI